MIKLVLNTINILILIKCVFKDSRPMYTIRNIVIYKDTL